MEEFQQQGIETLARLPFTQVIGSGAASGKPVASNGDIADVF